MNSALSDFPANHPIHKLGPIDQITLISEVTAEMNQVFHEAYIAGAIDSIKCLQEIARDSKEIDEPQRRALLCAAIAISQAAEGVIAKYRQGIDGQEDGA